MLQPLDRVFLNFLEWIFLRVSTNRGCNIKLYSPDHRQFKMKRYTFLSKLNPIQRTLFIRLENFPCFTDLNTSSLAKVFYDVLSLERCKTSGKVIHFKYIVNDDRPIFALVIYFRKLKRTQFNLMKKHGKFAIRLSLYAIYRQKSYTTPSLYSRNEGNFILYISFIYRKIWLSIYVIHLKKYLN